MTLVEFSPTDPDAPPSLDPNSVRDDVRELVAKYLQAIAAANKEPLLSVRSFFAFYAYILGWELGLPLLPLIGIINAVIWCIRRFSARQPNYIPAWSLRWTVAVFRSLHRGEIPLMKFVVNRNLVRLFTLWHIRGRLRHLTAQVDTQYVEAIIERDSNRMHSRDVERRLLGASTAAICQKAELKLLLLAVPLVELIAKVAHVGGSKHDFSLSGLVLTQSDPLIRLEHAHHILAIVVPAAYVLCLLVSCFIRKREILRALDVYTSEKRLRLPMEFPLDVVGWTVVMLIAALPIALRAGEWRASVTVGLLYSSPFGYAAIRRLWFGLHPADATTAVPVSA